MIDKIGVFINLYASGDAELTYFEWDQLNQKLRPYGVMLGYKDRYPRQLRAILDEIRKREDRNDPQNQV